MVYGSFITTSTDFITYSLITVLKHGSDSLILQTGYSPRSLLIISFIARCKSAIKLSLDLLANLA